jgi:REP element-mobilizing transposase RayT
VSPSRQKKTSREFEPALPEPLAFFLTWPTYGTWLPGDERGWVQYRVGMRLPDPIVEREAAARMTEAACRLDHEQRRLVETTIADHCRIRGWTLHAVNCRSNHVHVVVAANRDPDQTREQFKAWCTRRLKERDQAQMRATSGHAEPNSTVRQNWWAERGSGRYVNDEEALQALIHYVREAQDSPRGP